MFRAATFLTPVSLRRLGLAALACSALTLVGCGGGSRAKDYQPDSIVVFGDENSALTSQATVSGYTVKGLAYTVNPVSILSGSLYMCPDQTPGTQCADLTVTANYVPGSFVSSDLTRPNGTGYHFPDGPPDTRVNVVTMIGLGTAKLASNNSSVPNIKQTFDLQYNCTTAANWIQAVAHSFQLGFAGDINGCSKDYSGAKNYAVAGAYIAGLQTQVNNALSAGVLGKGTMATVWIGQNDLYDLLTSSTYTTSDAKVYQAKLLAQQLADVIKQILNTGSKVVVVGVTDLSVSPYAVSQASTSHACPGVTRSDNSTALNFNCDMQLMVQAFNQTLTVGDHDTGLTGLQNYVSHGRDYAYVDTYSALRSYASNSSYVVDSVFCESDTSKTDAMANVDGLKDNSSLANCNTFTYTGFGTSSTASTGTYLWADSKRLAPLMHLQIGSQAYNQAANQF